MRRSSHVSIDLVNKMNIKLYNYCNQLSVNIQPQKYFGYYQLKSIIVQTNLLKPPSYSSKHYQPTRIPLLFIQLLLNSIWLINKIRKHRRYWRKLGIIVNNHLRFISIVYCCCWRSRSSRSSKARCSNRQKVC